MDENHERFLAHVAASHEAVWRAAEWLHRQGLVVVMPSSVTRLEQSAHAEWKDYADDGDLYIQQRVEVKRLSVNFTSREDWPYGHRFIVCAKHSYDRANPKPWRYIIFSKDMQHAAIVRTASHERWTVARCQDGRYNSVTQECYYAPLDDVTFQAVSPASHILTKEMKNEIV